MHRTTLLAGALAALSLPTMAQAQDVRIYRAPEARAFAYTFGGNPDRAMLGISTSTGSARDTLGILVESVTPGSPAEKAGLEEGNRLAAINGVSLRLAAVDTGDHVMANAIARRLTREMGKVKAGDEVELRVFDNGQTRTVRVKTAAAEDLMSWNLRNDDDDDRAVIGVSLGSTGSRRDTLGVLLMSVVDSGPAALAGLEEGNRIASINGVDVRVPREDAGDAIIASARMRRLQRELEKVKPGDEVSLRVYVGGGRFRDLRLKTVSAADLPGRAGITIRQMFPGGQFNFEPLRGTLRRMETDGTRRLLEEMRPLLRSTTTRRIAV